MKERCIQLYKSDILASEENVARQLRKRLLILPGGAIRIGFEFPYKMRLIIIAGL